jgi:hypothetical protein
MAPSRSSELRSQLAEALDNAYSDHYQYGHGLPLEEMTEAALSVIDRVTAEAEHRLRLAHQARRAKEHQLDDIRRALCDIGFMDDDDPYSHADLAGVIRQVGEALRETGSSSPVADADKETVPHLLFDETTRRHTASIARVNELLAAIERVRALATRLEEFAENALKDDDRKLYASLASDLRTRIGDPNPGDA